MSAISLFWVGSVSLEIDIINEGIDPVWSGGDPVVVGLNAGSLICGCGLKNFWKRSAGFEGDEFRLHGNVCGEPIA